MIKNARENARKIELGLKILKNNDADEGRLFLMNEYGYETEDLEKMSDREILEEVAVNVGETIKDQQQLIQVIKDLAVECEDKLAGLEDEARQKILNEYVKELEKLEHEAKQPDLDFQDAKEKADKQLGRDNKLLRKAVDNQDKDDHLANNNASSSLDNPVAAKAEGVTDPFNALALEMGYDEQDPEQNAEDADNENNISYETDTNSPGLG